MSIEASRKQDSPLQTGPCPRCGIRLRESYKYCPNCSYRLRPELRPTAPRPRAPVPVGQRLVALGGYLAFASLLLLVVLAGARLFVEPEVTPTTPSVTFGLRDWSPLQLDRAALIRVDGGDVFYGLYDPAAYDAPLLPPSEEDEEDEDALPKVLDIYTLDDGFELAAYEVTNDQYYTFLQARAERSGQETPGYLYPVPWQRRTDSDLVGKIYPRGHSNYPVSGIRYRAAIEFCQWFWETALDADEDLVADLPTVLEYVRAARHEKADHNFPWGERLDDPGIANFSGHPLPVDHEDTGRYLGFNGLVGNVAEWVHSGDDEGNWFPSAAGFSFYQGRVLAESWDDARSDYRPGRRLTPFGRGGFTPYGYSDAQQDIGFRVLVRGAPARPEFARVERGRVQHRTPPTGLLRPARTEEYVAGDGTVFARHLAPEPVAVAFDPTSEVPLDFRMARTEITNRQYLHFLADIARREPARTIDTLTPRLWRRARPLESDAVFTGPYGNTKITRYYPPSQENYPVQAITREQVEAYAAWLSTRLHATCRLPTVAEFLRAARGDRVTPYPWGGDETEPELICSEAFVEVGRPVSLLGRLDDPPDLVGLAGNLPELVTDPATERTLLAGGGYPFPARLCTLDTFLDVKWKLVQLELDGGEARRQAHALRHVGGLGIALQQFPNVFHLAAGLLERDRDTLTLEDYAGFRVVLVGPY